jgi:hypothetical protein
MALSDNLDVALKTWKGKPGTTLASAQEMVELLTLIKGVYEAIPAAPTTTVSVQAGAVEGFSADSKIVVVQGGTSYVTDAMALA